MSYAAVCRIEPMTASAIERADGHQQRSNKETHIDPARTKHNQVVFGSGNIADDVAAGSEGIPLASEKTTILAAEAVLTAAAEYFDEISPNWRDGEITPAMQNWIDDSMTWAQKGCPGQVVSAFLNMDEQAPHLHVYIVPVATYDIHYRRGSQEVTKINYRKLFANTAQELKAAKDAGRSDIDTRLGRIQTDYADAMGDCGLVRGIRNSRATHQTIREFQRLVKEPIPQVKDIPFELPDVPGLLDRTAEKIWEYAKVCAKIGYEQGKKVMQLVLDSMAAKAKNHDLVLADNKRLNEVLVGKDKKIEQLELNHDLQIEQRDNEIASLKTEVKAQKEVIDAMRAVPLEEVAHRLEYKGELKWRNAIDMTKEVAGFNFNQSVAWLNEEFGKDAAVATGRDRGIQLAERAIETTPAELAPNQKVKQERDLTQQQQYDKQSADFFKTAAEQVRVFQEQEQKKKKQPQVVQKRSGPSLG